MKSGINQKNKSAMIIFKFIPWIIGVLALIGFMFLYLSQFISRIQYNRKVKWLLNHGFTKYSIRAYLVPYEVNMWVHNGEKISINDDALNMISYKQLKSMKG